MIGSIDWKHASIYHMYLVCCVQYFLIYLVLQMNQCGYITYQCRTPGPGHSAGILLDRSKIHDCHLCCSRRNSWGWGIGNTHLVLKRKDTVLKYVKCVSLSKIHFFSKCLISNGVHVTDNANTLLTFQTCFSIIIQWIAKFTFTVESPIHVFAYLTATIYVCLAFIEIYKLL